MRSILVLAGVAVLGLTVALLVPRSEAQTTIHKGPEVHAWEYKVVDLESLVKIQGFSREEREKMGTELEKGLNRLGEDGWEFCLEMRGPMVFKRPK